jgi:hypothetical protein
MDLRLTFADGRITGEGDDDVGPFLINGHYDADLRECDWLKTYPGAHAVYYRGYREGKGIWGRWDIGLFGHGGFHIWPRGAESGEEKTERVAEPGPAKLASAVADAASRESLPASGTSICKSVFRC